MRKKTLSIVAALFMCACGAWGQTWDAAGLKTSSPMANGDFVKGTVFYTIQGKANNGYLRSDALNGTRLSARGSQTNADEGRWAIIGTADGGFQIVNKASKKAIALSKDFTKSNVNDATNRTANASWLTDDFEDENTLFDIAAHVTTSGYWVISAHADNYYFWNDLTHLGYWYSEANYGYYGWQATAADATGDNGASFKFTEVEEYDPDTAVIHEEFATLLANVNNTWDLNNVPQQLSDALITDPEWFESPFTESSEGDITKLIDNDAKTFWHSKWSGDNVVGSHEHYLQVNLSEAIGGEIVMKMTRRDNNGESCGDDNPTVMSVEASSSHDGTFALVPGSTMDLPFNADKVGEVVSGTFTLTEPKQYLRFFADKTNGKQRGYWHCGEFQLYKVIKPSINSLNPEKAATLAAAIEKAAALTNPTQEDLNELQAAFDAYKEDLVTEPSTPVDPVVSEAEKAFKAAYTELKALVDQYVAGYDEESESYTFKVENLSDDAKNELIEDYWTIIGYAEDSAGYPESDEAFASSTDILKKSLADLQAALAETTPTEKHFPAAGDYYVYIKNYDTGRNPYLYNNVDEATGYTLQAADLDNANNGYIWHVTSDGNGKITNIVSGTGKGVGVNGGSKPVLSELDYEDAGEGFEGYYYIGNSVLGGRKWLNASSGGQTNGKGTNTVTNYGKENASMWTFETVNMEGLTAYNVVVEGCAEGLAVLNGEYAGNNGFFLTASAEGVEAKTIENYSASVSTDDNTITVTYTPGETLIAARQDAIVAALAKVGQLGYPKADADAVTALNNYTVTADNYAASTTLLANLYACTDVVMPEVGKSYRVAFRKSNDSLQYINGDATSATADDATVLTLAASETGNEFAYTLAGADGSYLTNKGVKSDATTVRAASINLKFGQLSASQYVTLDASKYYGAFALYTEKRYDKDDLGCLVMSESANGFDGANAPFFNGSYTSAIVLEEVENTPEVDPAIAEAKAALDEYIEKVVDPLLAEYDELEDEQITDELAAAYKELSETATSYEVGLVTLTTADDYKAALATLTTLVADYNDAKNSIPTEATEAQKAFEAAYDELRLLCNQYVQGWNENNKLVFKVEGLSSQLQTELMNGYSAVLGYAEGANTYPKDDAGFETATTLINEAIALIKAAIASDPMASSLEDFYATAGEWVESLIAKYGHVSPTESAANYALMNLYGIQVGYAYVNVPKNQEEIDAAYAAIKAAIKEFYESCTIEQLSKIIGQENVTLEDIENIKKGILRTIDVDELYKTGVTE